MTRPVDVLAVLDSLIEFHDTTDSLKGRNCIAARAAVAELIADHKALYRHCVNILESGYDRIIALGGSCDPVDRMEQGDPVLARSRSILAAIGPQS